MPCLMKFGLGCRKLQNHGNKTTGLGLTLNMKRIFCLLLPIFLSACDSGVEWNNESYEVIWIDTHNNRSLNYKIEEGESIGRVGAEIIAVGSNHKYIVAKQKDISTGAILFYYIDRQKDHKYYNWNDITQGPFSEKKYKQIQSELDLPKFTKKF